ncbi:hypothetical protein FRC12_002568 [Ceratobasidium sp. 428]|nr:hypothetical protein FRC12_002568 [Ceratobasidium sp. 428]
MGALLSTPDETIIQILALLPGKDNQRYRRVCRHLRELVDNTAQLQYLIELSHLGYIEPIRPRRDLTYDQKAKLLREHRLRGASPSHTFTLDTTRGLEAEENKNQTCTSLRDGIYVQGLSPSIHLPARRLNFYQLPSWNRGTELKKWGFRLGDVHASHVDLNYDLNLLCLVEFKSANSLGGNAPSTTVFNVHLRTLDSNDVHPGADLSRLSWRGDQEYSTQPFTWGMSSHIVENLLGILFTHNMSMTSYLIVWDWPSGSRLLHLDNIGYAPGSFTIINKRFIISHRPTVFNGADDSLGYLEVYRLDGLDECPSPMAILSLPRLPSHYTRRSTHFLASPPSSVSIDFLNDNHWYRPCPKLYELRADANHLCLIHLCFRSTSGWLAIPSSAIHKAVMECETNGLPDMTMVSWESWGRQTSWVHDLKFFPQTPFFELSSGLRTIAGTQVDDSAIIWDFNPRAFQSRGHSMRSEHEVAPEVCFPKEVGPEPWGRRDSVAQSPTVLDSAFFGDGSTLANQPFCVSSVTREENTVMDTMMQGEHSTHHQRKFR